MKTLDQKEWIAVVVAVFVIGFFFVFGPGLLSIFNSKSVMETSKSQLVSVDQTLGTGDEAQTGDLVTVHYTGKFVDGKVFDSSLSRGEPLQFVLGSGHVIEGWEKGIIGMKVGGTRLLTVPPEMGYGENDYLSIPGNSTLIFEVQLLKVEKGQAQGMPIQ